MCLALLQSPTRYISCPTHTHTQTWAVRSSHWNALMVPCDVGLMCRCQATSGDRSTCVYNGSRGVSSIRPSMRSLRLPAALDLADEEWAPRVCVCECFSSVCLSGHAWDTAISQDALVICGDGGLWIGLCARIQNRPIYQFVDILGWKSLLSTSDMMEVLPWSPHAHALPHSGKPAIKWIFFGLGRQVFSY